MKYTDGRSALYGGIITVLFGIIGVLMNNIYVIFAVLIFGGFVATYISKKNSLYPAILDGVIFGVFAVIISYIYNEQFSDPLATIGIFGICAFAGGVIAKIIRRNETPEITEETST